MDFLGRILRFLLWVLLVSWAVKLLGRAISWAKKPGRAPGDATRKTHGACKRLLKDPVCGIHMAEELALPLQVNGEMVHFCSQECRAKYESGMVRRAASA